MSAGTLTEAYATAHRAGAAVFPPACLRFVLETVRAEALRRGGHLTPAETMRALAEAARHEFGPLDDAVRDEWGLRDGADAWRALRLLETCGALSLAPEDGPEAFAAAGWPGPESRP